MCETNVSRQVSAGGLEEWNALAERDKLIPLSHVPLNIDQAGLKTGTATKHYKQLLGQSSNHQQPSNVHHLISNIYSTLLVGISEGQHKEQEK